MTWLLHFQWPAGVALIVYGILAWADGIEPVLGKRLSAYMETSAPHSPKLFLLGILSGSALHGKRGLQYCKRRYLAGLLSPSNAGIFALGMTLGIFLPATVIVSAPYYWAYALLILGISLQLTGHAPTMRRTGQALLGLGCCWVGYSACQQAPLPQPLFSHGIAGLIIIAAITHTPAAVFLAIAATTTSEGFNIPLLAGIAALLGTIWLAELTWTLHSTKRPFTPPLSLLSKYDLAFPERALQAALQENRRMATGLACAARTMAQRSTGIPNSKHLVPSVVDLENAMDEYKKAAQHYLVGLTGYKLHERQIRLLMFLFINVGDLERISDHLLAVAENLPTAPQHEEYPESILQSLDAMLVTTADIIDILARSMTGNRDRKKTMATQVAETRTKALLQLDHFSAVLQDLMLHNAIKPGKAIRMQDLRSHFERLIRHVRAISSAGEQADFWIEPDLIHERAVPLKRRSAEKRLTIPQMHDLLQEYGA
jgi:Na+/phosphate symporter